MLENKFKTHLKHRIEDDLLPGSMVLHLDPNEMQGAPDLIVLYGPRWGVLEGKKSLTARHQPNQDYYVELMNEMSFASFICPETEEEVLYELQKALRPRRGACIPRR